MFRVSGGNLFDVTGKFAIVSWGNSSKYFRSNAATLHCFDIKARRSAKVQREALHLRVPSEQELCTVEGCEVRERLVQLLNQI